MTKFLIAGLGSIGRRHLRNLIALGETDIVLLRTLRSTLPDEELPALPVETDLRQALRRHNPEAVVISNPTALHLDIAIPAADAGCALLLEKPISHSLDRVALLQDAVTRHHSKVLVGFQMRFHPSLQKVRRLIMDGRLGRLLSSRVSFGEYLPSWHPWEDYRRGYAARAELGGGALLTQCHSLDYLPWMVGKVESAWGYLGNLSDLGLDVEDSAEIGVRFVDGSLGSLHIDYAQQPPSHRLEILGTRGSVFCDLSAGNIRHYDVADKAWEEHALPQSWERNTMFIEEMRNFLALVRGEAESACTLDDGIQVMRLVAAVRESSKSGRRVTLRP